jgi:hypothetical protein
MCDFAVQVSVSYLVCVGLTSCGCVYILYVAIIENLTCHILCAISSRSAAIK